MYTVLEFLLYSNWFNIIRLSFISKNRYEWTPLSFRDPRFTMRTRPRSSIYRPFALFMSGQSTFCHGHVVKLSYNSWSRITVGHGVNLKQILLPIVIRFGSKEKAKRKLKIDRTFSCLSFCFMWLQYVRFHISIERNLRVCCNGMLLWTQETWGTFACVSSSLFMLVFLFESITHRNWKSRFY